MGLVSIPPWVDEVYARVASGDTDLAIDVLCTQIDDMLLADEFDACNTLLGAIDLARLDASTIVMLLSLTKRPADRLPVRRLLVAKASARLDEIAPGRTAQLLSGLG